MGGITCNEIQSVNDFLRQLQDELCRAFEKADGDIRFKEDSWSKADGGGGKTRVAEKGKVFEKAGVNFSSIEGMSLPPSASLARPELSGKAFQAMGVSLVIHPDNPYIPTSHANFRFFCTQEENPIWWFGGGYDLTPYYGFVEDCKHWHQTAYDACLPYGDDIYPEFKRQCDEYFFIPHRNETRGIGGLFFDDLNEQGFDECFSLVKSIALSYQDAYLPLVEKRKEMPYGNREKEFQKYRRGRYVEFNLVYDRGTLFGLQSGGRTESILMSLPPEVSFRYAWKPEENSAEASLYSQYLGKRDWLSLRL